MKHEKKLKEYEAVWTCDFCGEEFKTKKESDIHELACDKNPDSISFPLIRNIKKSWLILWITTMVVFTITVYINSKLLPQGLNLFNEKWFLNLFFGNIVLGIIAFLGTVFSKNKDRKKVFSIVKYSFVFCLIYLICNTGIVLSLDTSSKEQKGKSSSLTYQEPTPKTELQNVKYNGKVVSGTVVNKSDKPIFNSKVVLKISKDRTAWNIDETHEFIIPYKIDPNQSINFSENYKTTKKDPWWTTGISESKYYNKENIPTPTAVPTLTPKKTIQPTIVPTDTDPMVNCTMNINCGSGTRKIKQSECNNGTCCQIGSSWIFYTSRQKCTEDQNKYNSNYIYPTYAPYPTSKPIPTSSYVVPTVYATPTMSQEQAQLIIDQHNDQVRQCQRDVASNYSDPIIQNKCNYGDSSATEVCISIYQKERQKLYDSCGQIY